MSKIAFAVITLAALAASPAAAHVTLEKRQAPVGSYYKAVFAVPHGCAGSATVKLAPGGYHLMLMDLKQPFKQGDKVPVTLEFEKAGKVALSLDVQGVGAQAPAGHDHSGVKK